MTADLIRYDLLVQDALRGVVRKVLTDSAREGMPGDHHYYITFRTESPGVRLSTRMREKYPGEMTIILQHQFWDLSVTDQNFEVGLSFNNIPERLLIPFDSVTGFFDPSVQFGLKFEVQDTAPEAGANDTQAAESGPRPQTAGAGRAVKLQGKPGAKTPGLASVEAKAQTKPAAAAKTGKGAPAPLQEAAPGPAQTAAKVVSIDAFRKKP